MRMCQEAVRVCVGLVVVGLAVSVSAQNQDGANSAADVAFQQAASVRASQIAFIETNKQNVILDLVGRWSADAADGGLDAFDIELPQRLADKTAEELLELSEAASFNEFYVLATTGRPALPLFGAITEDLVFTPVPPCRLLDTRFGTGSYLGPFGEGQTVSFSVNDSLGPQGGNPAGCGIPTADPPALAIVLSSVSSTGGGNLRTFATGGAVAGAVQLIWRGGTNISTGSATESCTACGDELSVFVNAFAGSTHIVVDVVGYYHAPLATALNCTTLNTVQAVTAGATFNFDAPTCVAPATLTGGGTDVNLGSTPGVDYFRDAPNGANTAWRCEGINDTVFNVNITCFSRCCSIPGR